MSDNPSPDPTPGQSMIPIQAIQPRLNEKSRKHTPLGIVVMCESILILGLIHAIPVDTDNRFLAGARRYAALKLLSILDKQERVDAFLALIGHPKNALLKGRVKSLAERVRNLDAGAFALRYPNGLVPVHVIKIVNEKDRGAIECAADAIAKKMTPDEIRGFAMQLMEAGFSSSAGRPKPGEKRLYATLEEITGIGHRQLQRMLYPKEKIQKAPWEKAIDAMLKLEQKVFEAKETGEPDAAGRKKALVALQKVQEFLGKEVED